MIARLVAAAAILSLAACGNALTPRDRAMFGLPQNYSPPSYCGSNGLDPRCNPQPTPPGWELSGTVPIGAPSNVTPAAPAVPAGPDRPGFMKAADKQRWIEQCARAAEGNLPWCISVTTNW